VSQDAPDNDGSVWESQAQPGELPVRNKNDLANIAINRSYQLIFPADATTTGTIRLTGDLGGTATSPHVVGIQGKSVDSAAPLADYGLIFDGSKWSPKSIIESMHLSPNTIVKSDGDGYVSGVAIPGPSGKYKVLMQQADGYVVAFQKISYDMIDPAFSITSFSSTLPSSLLLEVGAALSNPQFSASYNKSITSVKLTGPNAIPQDVTSSPNSFTYSGPSITGSNSGQIASFTLEAGDGVGSKTSAITFTWGYNVYRGVASKWSDIVLTNRLAVITGMSCDIQLSRGRVFTITAGASEYIYYAIPASFGDATFTTNLTGGFIKVESSFDISGVSYFVYQSEQKNLGTTTVNVT
jgi:hypothetical protein